jgi:hypothetical protein
MVTIHLKGKLTDDRRLIVDIPDNIPAGDVQLTIEIPDAVSAPNEATARARAKFAAAGMLSTAVKAPPGTLPITEEELIELGTLPPGSPSILEMVDQDRGER